MCLYIVSQNQFYNSNKLGGKLNVHLYMNGYSIMAKLWTRYLQYRSLFIGMMDVFVISFNKNIGYKIYIYAQHDSVNFTLIISVYAVL